MSGKKVSGILRRAKRLLEVPPQSPDDAKSPDDAIWQVVCQNRSAEQIDESRISINKLFYKARAYVEQAGDFPSAIALAKEDEI